MTDYRMIFFEDEPEPVVLDMDKIVAACPMRDFVLVFSERGRVYKIFYGRDAELVCKVLFQLPVFE